MKKEEILALFKSYEDAVCTIDAQNVGVQGNSVRFWDTNNGVTSTM